jgi:hypothetical protein
MEDFFADLIGVYRAGIMDLAAAGCRYVQSTIPASPTA